ncbi:MAG TPA: glycosyltransferase family 4 protein [Allosphingosinicella sp.]|nr:glycosyltransferase family 4 protein [Allosphingosinicella sp.]
MSPSLRILVTTDSVGSLWQYGLDLARGLSRLGHETVLALTGPAASDAQIRTAAAVPGLRLVDTGVALDRLAEDEASLVRAAKAIALLADQSGADIVQLNTPALAALADFGPPVVAVLHSCLATWWETVQGTPLPDDFAWRTDLIASGLRAAGEVVVPTAAFGASVRRHYRLEAAPRTVHHGRSPLAVPSGMPHDFVFTAGRLWDQGKNLGLLDSAAGRIGVPVRAAGPIAGPNGGRVIFDNIDCLGALGDEELGRLLSARPVFVSTALYEPFGLAVLDAASAGCALVLSDIPAFRELWEEVAVFVDPNDEDGFARAIGDLAGDDFERAVLGRAARERAALYSPDAMAAQMAALYRGLLPAVRGPVLAAARAAA